jgi:hypothetical protein
MTSAPGCSHYGDDIFEGSRLAFLHQGKTGDGKTSRFNKFVERE